MASPNNRASGSRGGFDTIQNSRAAGRSRNETLQKYTFIAVGCMLALTILLLVVMAIGGAIGGDGESPKGLSPSAATAKAPWAARRWPGIPLR